LMCRVKPEKYGYNNWLFLRQIWRMKVLWFPPLLLERLVQGSFGCFWNILHLSFQF
jgi:hypothetical protein